MPSKILNLTVRERHKVVALEEIENALAEKVHHDADMSSEVEAIPQMDTAVPVLLVVRLQGGENSELDLAGVTVLLYRADDLNGNIFVASLVSGLHYFTKGTLTKEFDHLIYQ